MRAHVTLRTPDGALHHLGHGDLIGRLWTAALSIDDSRISEAHAMVSLRGDALKLLGLRGRFALDAGPVAEVVLAPGQRIRLARDFAIDVVDVVLPDTVLALEGPGLGRRVLSGVCALVPGPTVQLVPGHPPGAAATLWTQGDGWRVRVGDGPARALGPGDTLDVEGRPFTAVAVDLSAALRSATRQVDRVGVPLRVVAQHDSVHLFRAGEPTVALGGLPGRILSELVAFGGPTSWEVVAGEIWRDLAQEEDRHALRRKWDVNLSRLRGKLKAARVRADLIRSDRRGKVELVLYPGDQVDDRT